MSNTPKQGAIAGSPQFYSIEQAMVLAGQHQSQGRLRESEHLLLQILRQQPDHAFALHLLGVIAFQVGKLQQAVELIQRALQRQPNIALFHANLIEIYRQLKQSDKAISHGEKAVALDPTMVMAHSNLGLALFDIKDYARAEACHQQALQMSPNFAPSLNSMGSIRRECKHKDEAITWYSRAAAANPHHPEYLSNLGALLLEQDRVPEAAAALQKALQLDANYPEAVCNSGGVYAAQEDYEAALSAYRHALRLRPVYVEACMGMAKTLQSQDRLADAEATATQAIQMDSGNAKPYALLGSICSEQERPLEAEAHFNEALQLDPECNEALLGLGYLRMETGNTEQASALFYKALEFTPDNLAANLHLAQLKKVKAGDANLTALLEHEKKITTISPNNAIALEFALGKGFDELGDYQRAFPHFLNGCTLKRRRLTYDPAFTTGVVDGLISIFSKAALGHLRGGGDPSPSPIFVLGMPRSGTTLTEQIIASHPDVHGAGELHDLLLIAEREVGKAGMAAGFPANLRGLDQARLTAWGQEYIATVGRRAAGASRITDKMPANFFAVGLIHLMLPNAKIIHVNRSPVDTCLSCFTTLFRNKQEQSYDLTELGRYYADYARLMQHWRQVLPAEAFLDVHYEAIVANTEAEARRLIAYCGLEWNDACLDFQSNKRAIRTASLTQVRQPVYKSSVERWRGYEAFLGPLFEALGELAPQRNS